MSYSGKFKVAAQGIYSSLENIGGAKYDSKAKYYERLVGTETFNCIFWACSRKELQKFAATAILHSTGTLLDVGCGGLAQTSDLYQATTNDCTLFDRSLEMLKIAQGRLLEKTGTLPSNIHLLQGNAFDIPFPDNTFDNICSFGTIHLFDNKQDFVNELLRVLKKGGRFYFYTMTGELTVGRIFMKLLRMNHEFGEVWSEKQNLSLFNSAHLEVQSYRVGSVLFIYGQKIG
ncbi:MAG: class I SAM-dependent methyltransferase [Chitinophaga sp.]|uniref:class I SAM-dependent methyltransferase n=1 Tax=Chitinophaga sp. TaxID=1869181 RepID=UPI001B1E7220|nr:class I SAM-dependent methyltransferase [Chitinophaga sp.]MBO9728111.1 class I SAM-dependent methyltransferase [Chitinophaga sp.]